VLLPSYSETIVTTLFAKEVSERLQQATANTVQWDNGYTLANGKSLYGYVHGMYFQVAVRNMRLFSFNPLVNGTIEPTHNGCIIFLHFKLFVLTRVMLVFWSVFIFLSAIAIIYFQHNLWLALAALLLVVFVQWVAWSNFKLQLKPTHLAIIKLLE
jgi:hypothetical protein